MYVSLTLMIPIMYVSTKNFDGFGFDSRYRTRIDGAKTIAF